MHRDNGASALRFLPSQDGDASAIYALERCAVEHGVSVIETQGKINADSPAARLLTSHGYSVVGAPSAVFRIAVAEASDRLGALRLRLNGRSPKIVPASMYSLRAIANVAQSAALLDDFELSARAKYPHPGGIALDESSVALDQLGLSGFILVGRLADPYARELKVRWVAERHRTSAFVNLALLLACLDRANEVGVHQVYFSANVQRHRDTLNLAASLGAERCGEQITLARDVV